MINLLKILWYSKSVGKRQAIRVPKKQNIVSMKQNDKKIKSNLSSQYNHHSDEPLQSHSFNSSVQQILLKPTFSDFDLALLSKQIISNSIQITPNLSLRINKELNKLQQFDLAFLPELIQLSFRVGLKQVPIKLVQNLIERHKYISVGTKILKRLPKQFVKRICKDIINISLSREFNEFSQMFRELGCFLSMSQLKKIDDFCLTLFLNTEQKVKLLAAFRQLKRVGKFVETASQTIIEQKEKLSDKMLVSVILSMIELQMSDEYTEIQTEVLRRLKQNTIEPNAVPVLIQILHQYKLGSIDIWQELKNRCTKQSLHQCSFAVLSGLYRANFACDQELFLFFIGLDLEMSYLSTVKESHFVQLFLVLFANLDLMKKQPELQYLKEIFFQHFSSCPFTSALYKELVQFFLFLLTEQIRYLEKAYPNEIQRSLLSIAFPQINTTNLTDKKQYEQELRNCYPIHFDRHCKQIVIQEFVRHKLAPQRQKND